MRIRNQEDMHKLEQMVKEETDKYNDKYEKEIQNDYAYLAGKQLVNEAVDAMLAYGNKREIRVNDKFKAIVGQWLCEADQYYRSIFVQEINQNMMIKHLDQQCIARFGATLSTVICDAGPALLGMTKPETEYLKSIGMMNAIKEIIIDAANYANAKTRVAAGNLLKYKYMIQMFESTGL